MEQNQPFKKRAVEQTSVPSSQRAHIKTSTPLQRPQSQSQSHLPYQLVHVAEVTPQPVVIQQIKQTHQSDINSQRQALQPVYQTPQIVHYEYYEPPMTLNAWTQTNSEDFPPLQSSTQSKAEATLLDQITKLEYKLKVQTDELNELKRINLRSPSPDPVVSNSTTIMPSEIKHEATTYRILTQPNEVSNEIEIELSNDAENHNGNIVVHTSPISVPNQADRKDGATKTMPNQTYSENSMVTIGPNGTKISSSDYEKISWTSASIATRNLLMTLFDRETLATHSMTGKQSPAFKGLGKPIKGRLDPKAVQDIIHIVAKKCAVCPKQVRTAITTKCADENKMLRLKELKRTSTGEPRKSVLKESNLIKREQ